MTEPVTPASGVVSEIGQNGNAASRATRRTDLAHGPETAPVTPVRGIALPDPPDLDLDALLEQDSDATRFETPPANGEYSGPAPVRRLPSGISGDQLTNEKSTRLAAGTRWQRGTQLVEVVQAGSKVRFREIVDHDGQPSADPEKIHTLGRVRFLDTRRPA